MPRRDESDSGREVDGHVDRVTADQPDVRNEAGIDLAMVTMRFRASDPAGLAAVLSQYVVLTRRETGCRNVDFCVSIRDPASYVVLQKWDSPQAQRDHFDSPAMVSMAQSCNGLLAEAPVIELLDPISAHDLH